jgi:hypothetical protein
VIDSQIVIVYYSGMANKGTTYVTVSMKPDDMEIIGKLHKKLMREHGPLSVTALFRLSLRNLLKEAQKAKAA